MTLNLYKICGHFPSMVLISADRLCTRRLWRILKSQQLLQLHQLGTNSLCHQLKIKTTNIFMNQNNSLRVPSSFCMAVSIYCRIGAVGGTVDSESSLRSAGTLLSRVRALPPAPWPDGRRESLRSPCFRLAIYKKINYCRILFLTFLLLFVRIVFNSLVGEQVRQPYVMVGIMHWS
ncbi:hypothetical protein PoB_002157800 [Plakobranchus ocellatus]|uniref:Uncharacterized protein n=1 Tax=Plakobranchus ocellatus TaxID=259542 RepID=A0AAV3ZJR3_9GAST|nr:hypothetical protein PoB_002157800 [Plakobranchus ocellatus]